MDDGTAEAAQPHLELWRGIAVPGTLPGATLDPWDAARIAWAGAVAELAGIGDPLQRPVRLPWRPFMGYDAWSADPPPPIDITGTDGWQEFSAVSGADHRRAAHRPGSPA